MSKKLKRNTENEILFGVCAGLGDYLNVNPWIIRVAFVIFDLATAGIPGVIIYAILAIFLPGGEKKKDKGKRKVSGPQFNPAKFNPKQYTVKVHAAKQPATPIHSAPAATALDINRASITDLGMLPGLTDIERRQIIQTREKIHGFRSVEEVIELVGKPHLLPLITVSTRPVNNQPAGQAKRKGQRSNGRIVDF